MALPPTITTGELCSTRSGSSAPSAVVHAAVVGIPLAALLALLFAFPKTRQWARWPLAITVVGATAVTFVARESGLAFEAALGIKPGNPVGDLILQHSLLANQLFYIMIGFTVIGLLNVFLVSKHTSRGGRQRQAVRHRAHRAADSPRGRGGRCLGLDRPGRRSRRTCGLESHSTADDPVLIALPDRAQRDLRSVMLVTSITGR